MAFTFKSSEVNSEYGDNDSIALPEINVAVGDLIVVGIRTGTPAVAVSSVTDTAGNTYSAIGSQLTIGYSTLDVYYSVATSAHATDIITATFASSKEERKSIIGVVKTPDGGETVSYDVGGTDTNIWGDSPTTSAFTTTGDDEAAIAFVAVDSTKTLTEEAIAGEGSTEIATDMFSGWYNIFDAIKTDATATGTLSSPTAYCCRCVTFKSEAGAPPAGNPWYAYAQQ